MGALKGYKPSDVGLIPDDWEVKPVGQMGAVRAGKALAASAPGTQRPYLRTKNVFDGRIDLDDVLFMPMSEAEFSRNSLRYGDVLLNEGQSIDLVGRCAMYRNEYPEPCAMQNQLVRFRAAEGTSAGYAEQVFRHCQKTGVFSRIALQTTSVAHLGVSRFEKLQLAWPRSVLEQEAIAEALSDADSLIESLGQLLVKKRQIKQGAMQGLLSGRRRLPGFSEVWQEKALGELFSVSGGLSASREQLSTTGHCYLHYGDIHTTARTWIDLEAEHLDIPRLDVPLGKVSSTALLDDGDVVFVDASEDEDGASRHVVVVNPSAKPFISGLHTIVAKASGEVLDKVYRRYCFQAQEVRQQFRFYAVGTKVSGVSKSNIVKIVLSVPPLPEQSAIADILSDMDADLAAVETKLTKVKQIKQGMTQQLLTGRIRLPVDVTGV
ncbi:restriction endonuclease subunit S [Arenimonas sp. MALMAid1274]|uniref:restriction endonuclease subunit S n=1 Tax=Arenimonas sp. MALMAid1274 TaxID=3411630 RepID=UPI003BA0330C